MIPTGQIGPPGAHVPFNVVPDFGGATGSASTRQHHRTPVLEILLIQIHAARRHVSVRYPIYKEVRRINSMSPLCCQYFTFLRNLPLSLYLFAFCHIKSDINERTNLHEVRVLVLKAAMNVNWKRGYIQVHASSENQLNMLENVALRFNVQVSKSYFHGIFSVAKEHGFLYNSIKLSSR